MVHEHPQSLDSPFSLHQVSDTFCPAGVGVCAPYPGKPYSSVEGRKPFTRKSPRRRWEFAPHPRESLILPSRGANLAPGKAAVSRESLRPIPGKALFLRREAQTFCPGNPPAAVGVCAPLPGKPYSSVGGRQSCAGKSRRRPCEFAPHPRESLIPPSRGANLLTGKPAAGRRTQMKNPASVSSLTGAGFCHLKFYSVGLSGWISGIISTSRFT